MSCSDWFWIHSTDYNWMKTHYKYIQSICVATLHEGELRFIKRTNEWCPCRCRWGHREITECSRGKTGKASKSFNRWNTWTLCTIPRRLSVSANPTWTRSASQNMRCITISIGIFISLSSTWAHQLFQCQKVIFMASITICCACSSTVAFRQKQIISF